MIRCKNLSRKIFLTCLLMVTGLPVLVLADENADSCAAITDDKARLNCYDEKTRLKPEVSADSEKATARTQESQKQISYLSKKWQLDEESRKNPFAIMAHRANYILLLDYNFNPNTEPYKKAFPNFDMQNEEVKFQLSLKVKLWESMFKSKADLWFGYTQLSFWQLYNTSESCPFLETNYEPEILINYRMDADIFGIMRNRFIQVGFDHQSNGLGGSLSRSWNRIVANFGFERGPFDLVLKTWLRIPENEDDDDNPDIIDYLGHGEIVMGYHYKDWAVGLMFRNNLKLNDNRSGLELDLSFPLVHSINGYVQYFAGYGQSLIDYDHFDNSLGIGVIVKDW
jgi:phospholipase A1